MLNDGRKNLSVTGPWIEEIKSILRTFLGSKVTLVRRSPNYATNNLAKLGVGVDLCKIWLMVPPDLILVVFADEIPDVV